MDAVAEISFCELRTKEIVNIVDGKRLGRIVDLVFECDNSKIKGLVAPFDKKIFFFRAQQDIFIPWKCVKKIGADTIIVELKGHDENDKKDGKHDGPGGHGHTPYPPPFHFCDRRCSKCSYQECPVRWEGEKKADKEAAYKDYYQGGMPNYEK